MLLQTVDLTQRKAGYTSLEHSVPVLCFGEGKDLELSLCAESNSLPIATQVLQIPPQASAQICFYHTCILYT